MLHPQHLTRMWIMWSNGTKAKKGWNLGRECPLFSSVHWIILCRMKFISHEWTWNSDWSDFEKIPICFAFQMGFSFAEKFWTRDYVNTRHGHIPKGKTIQRGFLGGCIEVWYITHNLFPWQMGIVPLGLTLALWPPWLTNKEKTSVGRGSMEEERYGDRVRRREQLSRKASQ